MKTYKTFSSLSILLVILLHAASTYSQVTVREVTMDARTHYDIQSNGSSFMIEQSQTNPSFIHAVFTVSTDPGPGWDNRNGRYFVSTSGGTSWDYVGTVSQRRAGFPVLGITNDNKAIVGINSTENGGLTRFYLFVDLLPGVGSWTVLDPGGINIGGNLVVDQTNNKVFFTASGYVNVCTNLTAPGTFLGYTQIPGSESNSSSIGIGTGRTGIAYITGSNPQGGVKLIETTNGGVTWGTPVNIWVPNYITGDSMGALRGIDIAYTGSTPCVVFEVCKQGEEVFFPQAKSKIMFWSPLVNGGNAFAIDSAEGLSGSNSVNDVFTSVCRPVIGKMSQSNVLITAYCKARQDTDAVGNNFFDINMVCLSGGGTQWGSPYQITNLGGQFMNLHDCRYVSISDFNWGNTINLLFQADTIPASNVNGASDSWAKMMYAKYDGGGFGGLRCTPNGISNMGTEIPSSFILKQNYPNPFNPVTQIEFDIPQRSFVTFTIYNAVGERVEVLVNGNFNAGSYRADWDASSYPSGVYFYELNAEGYKETKKMVLVK